MNNDLISRSDLINAKPEFMNEKVIRDTKYRTTKDRIYAKAWNACNSYWLNTIKNAPKVEEVSVIEFKEPLPMVKAQKIVKALSKRSQGEWIIVDDCEQFIAKCSVCGRIEDSRMVKDYPFCHCGAAMRGKE